jgi:hypothetical protein
LAQSDIHLDKTILVSNKYPDSPIANALKKVIIYDFAPVNLSSNTPSTGSMERTGEGIAYALVDILHANRKSFDELEERLTRLVPNIQRLHCLVQTIKPFYWN